MRKIAADLTLLHRSVVYAVFAAIAFISGLTAWITRTSAVKQLDIIKNAVVESGLDPRVGACNLLAASFNTDACFQSAGGLADPVFLQSLLDQYSRVIEATSATSMGGALGFAARQTASMVGFVALALLICLHTTELWETGASRRLIPKIGLVSIIRQKCVSLVLIVALLPLVSTVGVFIGGSIPTSEPLPPSQASLSMNLRDLGAGYFVLLAVGLLAIAVSVFTRSMVFAFVIATAVLAISFFGTLDPSLYFWSPAGWVATVMRFDSDSRRQVVDFFWTPEVAGHSAPVAVIALLCLGLLPMVVAVITGLHRRPLA